MVENSKEIAKRIFGLDLIRAFSVFLILFSHSSWIYPPSNTILSKAKDMSGFFGIEIFLVMSGFLVGNIIYKQFNSDSYGLKEVKLFLLRRLTRVLPSYYFVIIINSLIGLFFGYSLLHVWKYFLLFQNFSSGIYPFFPESWSLPIKELGYIIAVFLLFITLSLFRKTLRKTLFLTVIIGLMLLSVFAKVYYNLHSTNLSLGVWSLEVRSVVIYRIDSVLFGILLSYGYSNYHKMIMDYKKHLFVFGLLLLLLFFLLLTFFKFRLDNAPWFWNVWCLPFTSFILCLIFPVFFEWKEAPNYYTKPIRFFCNISYSVYLIHYSIVLFLLKYFIDTSHFSMMQLHFFTLLYLVTTIILSYFFYNYFEKPINNFRLANFKLDKNR